MKDLLSASNFNDYDVLKQIGKGAYGIVFKVKHRVDKAVYALKTIEIGKMDNKALTNTLNEIRILCSINHPNIVGYKEAFLIGTTLCVVMEYVGGGDLAEKIASCKKRNYCINEESIWKYTVQILNGLKELHSMKILHRDIKSANIFLSEDFETVKLGDLNIAKVAKEDFASTQIGTPYYLAPEIWTNQKYDYRCDIFSLGCVVYEMATLRVPFDASTIQELFKKITQCIADPIPSRYSSQLSDMIRLFLAKNPKNRPTVNEALDIPIIKAKVGRYVQADCPIMQMQPTELLSTITIPQNLNLLKNKLPKRKHSVFESKGDRRSSRESTYDTYSTSKPSYENRYTVQSSSKHKGMTPQANGSEREVGKQLLSKIKMSLTPIPSKQQPSNTRSPVEDRVYSKIGGKVPIMSGPYGEYVRCNSLQMRSNSKSKQNSSRCLAR